MTLTSFDLFIGIDWSGAKGRHQRGIAVATCDTRGICRLVRPLQSGSWNRTAVLAWLLEAPCKTLAGFDFAFSLPWPETGPFPVGLKQPASARELWHSVEDTCRNEPNFYAGPIFQPEGGWLAAYMFTKLTGQPRWSGADYDSNRLREVESLMRPRPNTAFKIVGAKTVGPGSFSGMRVLAALGRAGRPVSVWPFDEPTPKGLTVVEIYPSYYYGCAGSRRSRVPETIAAVLTHFKAESDDVSDKLSQDEADALVSAAAIRHFASQQDAFHHPGGLSAHEGWIFGMPAPNRVA